MPEPQGQAPENRSSLSTILLITGAMMAVYYGYTYFFRHDRPTTDAQGTETLSADEAQARTDDAVSRRRARADRRQTGTIRTALFEATIDNLAGALWSFQLLGDRFRDADGHQQELVTTGRDENGEPDVTLEDYLPMRISIPGVELPADIVWELTQENEQAVTLRWEGNGVEVRRRIEAGTGPYQLWQTVLVRNTGDHTRRVRVQEHGFHYVPRAQESTGFFSFGARSTYISQGLCRHEGEVTRKARGDLAEAHGYGGTIDFVGLENQYFAQAYAPSDEAAERCGLWAQDRYAGEEVHGTLFESQLRYPIVDVTAGGEHMTRTLTFFGPKDWASLESAGHGLPEVVNLGTFAVIARQFARLLAFIESLVGNWGLAIIILTFLVRLALYPVMARQFRAFAPMRKIKPEMDEINAKFADDMERRQAAIMDLYKKHGINPAAQMLGCLPILLQMPVFFALYTSLSTNIELYHQPFALWWTDLSAPDRFFSLPIALSALMHVQQRLTPTQMDPAQQKIMLWMMPIMMGVFMLFLPSGLCLYMLTNSSLSITQQRFNEWRWQREEAEKDAARAAAAASAKTNDGPSEGSAPARSAKTSTRRPPRG
ncbi:MAG: membrane protein insertase YidC [Sandaracinaceae bacterium]|nr:membrane protein insertase YidC [Sandaracinaceae bacterium]